MNIKLIRIANKYSSFPEKEVFDLQETSYITIISKRRKVVLSTSEILYLIVVGRNTEIHISGGTVYETRMTLGEFEEKLGDSFVKIHRGCIVSAMAIHNISEKINLINGETLSYTIRKKKVISAQVHEKKKQVISSFLGEGIPKTEEEYREHYKSFDNLPFAFTDIEMVFDEERHAVDWIFRYGNTALAKLEKLPLEQLLGSSFGSLFPNMDSKWLRSYEQSALYGKVLEIMDYSPEIDTYLKVISFQTFKGHCGCILFDISDIKLTKSSSEAEMVLKRYLGNLSEQET